MPLLTLGSVMAERNPDRHGFWRDTWRELRGRPKFVVAAALILFVVVVAMFPSWFTAIDPSYGDPSQSLLPPSAAHWFGTDLQGHDIYARTVYGARASNYSLFLTTSGGATELSPGVPAVGSGPRPPRRSRCDRSRRATSRSAPGVRPPRGRSRTARSASR